MASLEEAIEKNAELQSANDDKAAQLAKMRQTRAEFESQALLNEERLDTERKSSLLDAELEREQRLLDDAKNRASIRAARAESAGVLDSAKAELTAEQALTKAQDKAAKDAADSAAKAASADAGEGK